MYGETYIGIVTDTIKSAWETQREELGRAADLLAGAVTGGGGIFIFGCSHAGILAEEVFYRTGGLAVINPIFYPGFMLNTRPITLTSQLERLDGLGEVLLEKNRVGSGDVLIIHSVSGRNNVPVEMADCARRLGATVIGITNVAYSSSVKSRHPSGKRLFEACDLVIDNKGVCGDAAVRLEGLPEPVGPTSTACGAALLNAIVIETEERLLSAGVVPPVFMSANLDGGDLHNQQIFDTYKEQIHYE